MQSETDVKDDCTHSSVMQASETSEPEQTTDTRDQTLLHEFGPIQRGVHTWTPKRQKCKVAFTVWKSTM